MTESDLSKEIMDTFMQMGYVVGVEEITMRIYSVIWMAEEPISQNEIQDVLRRENVSLGKSLISLTLKNLLRFLIIEKVKKANDRTYYYKLKNESLIETFQLNLSTILGRAENTMNKFKDKYNNHKLGKKFIHEVDKLHSFFKYILTQDSSKF